MQMSPTFDSRSAGFTLIEVLATLGIVALMASAVLLMSPDADSRLRGALEKMAARIDLAGDQSIMMNRQLAFVATRDGYHFERLDEDGWRRLETVPALGFEPWPGGDTPVFDTADPADAEEGATHRLSRFDPLGGATPMLLRFGSNEGGWRVEVDDQGAVHVERAS
jgi:general secretion pathway protein H